MIMPPHIRVKKLNISMQIKEDVRKWVKYFYYKKQEHSGNLNKTKEVQNDNTKIN